MTIFHRRALAEQRVGFIEKKDAAGPLGIGEHPGKVALGLCLIGADDLAECDPF